MEFDASESIDEFTLAENWWGQLRSAVDSSDAQARSLIDGHLALFGADPNAIGQLDKHLNELLATKV